MLLLGDIHGFIEIAEKASQIAKGTGHSCVIQVGDWGFDYRGLSAIPDRVKFDVPVYTIDGNHDNYSVVNGLTEVTELKPNLFYVPRGKVLDIEGLKVGFMGGADSVDKKWQQRDGCWWSQEIITDSDIAKMDDVIEIDLFVTHTPPQSIIERHFDPKDLLMFDLPVTWKSESAIRLDKLWRRLNYPPLVCGHMHRQVYDRQYNVLILDINACVAFSKEGFSLKYDREQV